MDNSEYEDLVYYWDRNYPGKGAALAQILAPFHSWEPKLMPALADLEERARKAVFWRGLKSVKAVGPGVGHPHWESLCESLWAHPDCASSRRYPELTDWLDWEFGRVRWRAYRSPHVFVLCTELRWHLFFSCAAAVEGRIGIVSGFKPLREMWLAGNFVYGLDIEGNLYILVAG